MPPQRPQKVTWYLKALPKAFRNRLIPLHEVVTAFLVEVAQGAEALPEAIRDWIRQRLGEAPSPEAWDTHTLPPHLLVNVRVVDASGRELALDRDLAKLRQRLGEAAQMTFAASGPAFERKGLRRWDFGDLPQTLAITRNGQRLTGYPALVDDGDSASLALLDTPEAAEAATRAGVVRLISLALGDRAARASRAAPALQQAALALKTVGGVDRLAADVQAAIADRAFIGDDPLPRTESAFAEQVKRAKTRLPAVTDSAHRLLGQIAAGYMALAQRLAALPASHGRFAADIRGQRDDLVQPGFFGETPWPHLQHVPRYLKALERRVAKYLEHPDRDARHAQAVAALSQRYRERAERNRIGGRVEPGLETFRWLLEELKVSLFAQELKTPFPVSFKRVEKAWSELDA